MICRDHEILFSKAMEANTLFSRLKGLLGTTGLLSEEALILDPCTSIHTFFMKFPIDVIFLDRSNKIIALYSNLNPNRVSGIHWTAKKAVETPAGSIAKLNLQKGQVLSITGGNHV